MSKLQELIREFCPDGVEYKKLGEIGTFTRGNGLQKKDFTESGVGCIHYGQIYTYYGTWATKTITYCSPRLAKKLRVAHKGDIVIATTSENVEDVCKAVAWLGDDDIVVSGDAYIFAHNQNPKYVSYIFQTQAFFDFKRKNQTGTKVIRVSGESMAKFEIPVPPLPVQEEIVRILDHFSDLAAELQARREQYEYYRDKLLTFNEFTPPHWEIRWVKMSEIGTFIRGNGLQKKDFTESGVPCIHYGQIYTYYGTFASKTKSYVSEDTAKKCKKAHSGDLVIASTSENVEDVRKTVAWLGKEDIAISNHTFIFSHNQNPKYLSYLFQTEWFAKYKKTKAVGVKVIDIPQKALEDLYVPIPSFTEQERIVSILDKFEDLINNLSEGLPAEIAAVREQYEYYKNKLLSFPRTGLPA